MSDEDLVFGMGAEPVARRDWPSLASDEVEAVLGEEIAEIERRSPRPLSTTARIRTGAGRRLIVKRLPRCTFLGAFDVTAGSATCCCELLPSTPPAGGEKLQSPLDGETLRMLVCVVA